MTGLDTPEAAKKHTDGSQEPERERHSETDDNRTETKLIERPVDRPSHQPHKNRPRRHHDTWPHACP